MSMMAWLLVSLPILVGGYAYLLYPAILWLISRGSSAPQVFPVREWPLVTVAIPAYNEEAQIAGCLEAVLAQDYPIDRLQILVLSDASSDRTDDIVRGFQHQGVELLRMTTRAGKTAAENASCSLIRGNIVVNTDASIRFHPSTVRKLVEQMQDPSVGVASTRDVSISERDASANQAEAGYVGYEMLVRSLETRVGGIIGASGSGYAIRTDLHKLPVRDDLSRDFSAALTARMHGYRAVSVDDAICYVPRTHGLDREYRRKVRTISRGMETLYHNRQLLDPTRYGAFAWKLFSHKILRWFVPHAALAGVVGVAMFAPTHWITGAVLLTATAACAGAFVLVKLSGERHVPAPISALGFAVAANIAVIHASWRFALGHEDHIWEPTRRGSPATGAAT
ncbi:MAG: glycosyltransferase [Gemmatimonadota bacterium]